MRVNDKNQPISFINQKFTYTPDVHTQFNEAGFVTIHNFLTKRAVAYLREEFDTIINNKHPSVHNEWVLSLHQSLGEDNWLWKLATEPALLEVISFHLGDDLILYSSQLAFKPAHGGTEVPWHQDGENLRTVWIPLDDIDENNGGLIVQPGWHKKGRIPIKLVETEEEYNEATFNMKHSVFRIEHGMSEEKFLSTAVTYKLPAGSLEIHHPSLPHRSFRNTSDKPRRVLILRYQPTTERIFENPIMHHESCEPFSKKNYLVKGRFGKLVASKSLSDCYLPI